MTPLAAYMLLFVAVGVGFIFVHLVAGKLIRPSKKNPEKDTIYECGEPTIGSAWVQFDLRFYVVALLFVIFDVEVAFFFPWAEVFGKSNAIRATAEPKTLEEYRAFAAKVNDLVSPRGSTSGQPLTAGVANSTRERELWRKLETMTPEEYEAYNALKGDLTRMMRDLGERGYEAVRSLTPEQLAAVRQQAKALDGLLKAISQEQKVEAKRMKEAVEKLSQADKQALDKVLAPGASGGVDGMIRLMEGQPAQVEDALQTRSLNELRQISLNNVEVYSMTPQVEKVLLKVLPEPTKSLKALAVRQRKELMAAADASRSALLAAAPAQSVLWDMLSLKGLGEVAALTPEQMKTMQALSPQGVQALETPRLAAGVKDRVDRLAWLALVEILVFFGVLLVGFAYLWRRGDLAWVRSTAAESKAEA